MSGYQPRTLIKAFLFISAFIVNCEPSKKRLLSPMSAFKINSWSCSPLNLKASALIFTTQKLLSFPGPSVIPDRVLNAMHRNNPNIYEGELVDIVSGIIPDLKRLAKTNSDVAIYISNGHGA